MTVKIDKGIPMPPCNRAGKYPWKEMEVGDSFLMDGDPVYAANTANKAGRKHGRKFSSRKTREGMRVWRVA